MAQGQWTLEERILHISVLELRAVRLALLQFWNNMEGRHVLIRTDNTVAKVYINRQEGTLSRTLNKEVTLLFEWAEWHLLNIQSTHLAGMYNTTADWLSRRKLQESEWQLYPQVF